MKLSLDIETYSPVDLRKTGVYPYAEHPDFAVLLFGYAFDGEPVEVVDLARGEALPERVVQAMTDPAVTKWAFNAAFERICLSRYFDQHLPIEQWRCTSVLSLSLGLPQGLADTAKVLNLGDDKQKMAAGPALIRYFCVPCKPTARNGGRARNFPDHDADKWALFKAYCARDVEVERTIRERLLMWDMPAEEWELYHLDQKINDAGMLVDLDLVDAAIALDDEARDRLSHEFVQLTGLDNPRAVAQLKAWLAEEHEIVADTLNKADVAALIDATEDADLSRALQLRQQLSKSSVAKYHAMRRSVCKDGRIRGLFQFYGANRTGRWAGRIVQAQNLPRSNLSPADLALARDLVKARDADAIALLYGQVAPLLSELIRTAFVAPPGKSFVVVDFSAIEARMLAWGAGETWRMDVFNTHGRIYEASAEQMFNLPAGSVTKHSPYRQKGKVAELACIAEGQLVLTDGGLVPIEDVTAAMRVWDGVSFVRHQGVVCQGTKEVIDYDGLVATRGHTVWTDEGTEEFGDAARRGSRLIKSGAGRHPLRVGRDHQPGTSLYERLVGCVRTSPVLRLWSDSLAQLRELDTRKNQGRPRLARVFDIVNAGPNNRFTVSGRLVHNCGYQGGPNALVTMGALDMGLNEAELPAIISAWRNANPAIVAFWYDLDADTKTCLRRKVKVSHPDGRYTLSYESGILFMRLPSGRSLAYVKPKIVSDTGYARITFEGMNQVTKQWGVIDTFGGRLAENWTQAVSRDCLREALFNLDAARFKIVGHIHDEVIVECDTDGALQSAERLMSLPIDYFPGLPLKGEGFTSTFYRKDA